MKGKYITLQIRLACAKKQVTDRDFFEEVEKTILEHRRIMQEFAKPEVRRIRVIKCKRETVSQ